MCTSPHRARRRQPALCPASGTSALVRFESWSWVCAGVSARTLAAHSRWESDTVTTTWKPEARGRLVTAPTATDLENNRTRYGARIQTPPPPKPPRNFYSKKMIILKLYTEEGSTIPQQLKTSNFSGLNLTQVNTITCHEKKIPTS